MPDKTKTIVVIESHEQTIIRRTRRTVSGQVLIGGAVARPLGRASSDAPEPAVMEKPKGRWWRTVALKGVTVFAPWSRRLKHSGNERRNKQP
jgi:hypothetical protein